MMAKEVFSTDWVRKTQLKIFMWALGCYEILKIEF